ncbi:TetR/AcrR family transcriptional regulator [Aliifodinibius sp. S!AR15-10]|uniref:TetR/AcrR family transcriptional regulator n=1 Tax=Aliifodinibius sp. S!AR15-10 TaxID=2950437 RepID=UPI00285D1834|nr:TetR/AcrR family transcriptional regulator [Aliifodinibius sp. S!AR15-10]MDR8393712.1 TetR/AcrR family transcriptional regulator [Aliifodinibius sp. S!AR15-10]
MKEQESTIDTKDKILESAYNIFVEKGGNGSGIKEIAEKADVNKAMLYYYFDSKEHLFKEVFRKAIEESGLKVLETMEDSSTPLFDKIKRYIDALTDHLLEEPIIFSFVMNELNRHPEVLTEILVDTIDFDRSVLDRQINEAADRYEIARINPRQLLANITSLCLGPIINRSYYSVVLDISSESEYRQFLEERKGIIYDMTISWLTT